MALFDWALRWRRSNSPRPARSAAASTRSPLDRLVAQWRAAATTPLKPFPLTAYSASNAAIPGGLAVPVGERAEVEAGQRPPMQIRDFYSELAGLGLPPRTLHALHAFVATLPSSLAPPVARRPGDAGFELTWAAADGRRLRARIDGSGLVINSARLGDRGRFDGAEPIGERLSPLVLHAIRQLAL